MKTLYIIITNRFATLLLLLFLSFSINAQSLHYECDINTINKQLGQTDIIPLNENFGHVIVPVSKYKHTGDSGGLLIYHHQCFDEYYAFDTRCPKCNAKGRKSTIIMETCFLAVCKKCYTQWQNICLGIWSDTNAGGEYPLKCYNVYYSGDKLIITDEFLNIY